MKTKLGRTVKAVIKDDLTNYFPKPVFNIFEELMSKTERVSRLNKEYEMIKLLKFKGLIEKHWSDQRVQEILLEMLAVV